MNAKVARRILLGCAWSGADDHEREVAAARRKLKNDAAFAAELARQVEFDRTLGEKLQGEISAEDTARLEELSAKLDGGRSQRHWVRDPAMLAVGLAFVVVFAVMTWIDLGSGGVFGGLAEVEKLARVGDGAGIEQFQAAETKAGTLGDWFVMQGFDGFQVPRGFENAPVVGVRLFTYENEPVAVAAIAEPRSFIYVFRAEPFGVDLASGAWRIDEYDKGRHSLAMQQIGPMVFMTTMRGPKSEMSDYVGRAETAK